MPDTLLRTNKDIEESYNRNVDTIYRICFMYMKNKYDAEDAVASTFTKMIEKNPAFQSEKHETAWLIVTASNICKNLLKHWWRKNQDIFEVKEFSKTDVIDETLQRVLKLPTKYKLVLFLYYYEGYSTVEMAKLLHIKETTIRTQLHTGRNILKESLGGEEE